MVTNNIHKLGLPVFSTGGKVVFIISLFVLISVLLGGMIFWYGNIFDGVRSYVRGEGLWAKAQKDAVFYLSSYSYNRSETDYAAYQQALNVISGDKNARLALLQSPPNYEAAKKGFLQGQNHPDDVDSMITFFLTFQHVSYMRDAIFVWQSADQTIDELKQLSEQIRTEIRTNPNPGKIIELRERLRHLNSDLYQMEIRFSLILSEGARWVKQTTWRITVLALVLFIGIGLWVSRQIINSITKAERELIISESRFRRLKESNTIGIISWRIDGTIEEANDLFLTMLGYNRSDFLAGVVNWRDITPVEFQSKDQQAIDELLTHGRCEPYEKALIHKQGHSVPVYIGAAMQEGSREQGIAYVMDLSERKKAEQQLKLAATVFAGTSDGILVTDASARIVSVNQALCKITGYDESEFLGQTPSILQSGYTSDEEYKRMWESLYATGQWQGDVIDRMKNGGLIPMRISINQVRNADNQLTHYIAILSDISERKAEEEHLRHIAHHDPLTGLANRVLFNDRLEQAIKSATRNKTQFAVLFLDLDKFKPVNDLFGHKIGDKLLQAVADRMVRNTRKTDTVARLGGDEFVILLENVSNRKMVKKLLNHITDAVCRIYPIDHYAIEIGVSAGISIYPDHGSDAKTLLHHADIQMYERKEAKGSLP
ncbi:sensor domain-containing protein [Candidatus Methylobacter oryzae]|uniref:Diguanylate cyclase n=1 Tax=Candidatus Methylobacter oryzae TaxID=2497749 RepID=A0ABY3CBU8_9GAMM|nr:sensor domain-containing diguanylate cyclase [Candidatus Methylobacter oryzae]TRW95259.1 diguanylate cyclase [Candidatus Methylobacter oryzae]